MRQAVPVLAACITAATVSQTHAQMSHPPGMSHQQVVTAATAGGPRWVSDSAAVGWIDSAGQVNTMRPGSNGFTCLIARPDFLGGPICADRNAMTWLGALLNRASAPPATPAPGIAYMARGGFHYSNPDGTITIDSTMGTRRVTEGPHWMMFAAFDPATSGLPARHMSSGTYIMWAGTPWAHLMIMQDPMRMSAGMSH